MDERILISICPKKRADAIKEYIVYFGHVEDSRIETRGYGSSNPIVEEETDEDKKLNRRVEFQLYKESGS